MKLLPCPFCGGEAEIERIGDHSRSTIYGCTDCGASLETGEEWDHGRMWNQRASVESELLKSLQAELDEAGRRAGAAERKFAMLHDPNSVHIAMIRGDIAKISMRQCAHVHGEKTVELWNTLAQEEDK